MKKIKLDKTSVVMIVIFCVLIVGALAGFVISSMLNGGTEDVRPENENEQVQQEVPAVAKPKFEKFTDLSDKFLEVCKAGDIEALYDLYYDGLLDETRLNMETVPTKEEFDAGLRSDMLSVTGFEEYEYGTVELPPTQSPGSYAAFIYNMANNGKTLPINDADIENCVNLVVYIDNMYQTNHFMVQVDGYWYFIV